MTKIYTKTGDDGTTGTLGSDRLFKSSIRFEAIGDIDELSASLGVIYSDSQSFLSIYGENQSFILRDILFNIMKDLFDIGAITATTNNFLNKIDFNDNKIKFLEDLIDIISSKLPELKNFIFPTGTRLSSKVFLARAIARRAERHLVKFKEEAVDLNKSFWATPNDPVIKIHPDISNAIVYLNRLSDFLFVLARFCNITDGNNEKLWIRGDT